MHRLARHASLCVAEAIMDQVELPPELLQIGGFCGRKTRELIHRLCEGPDVNGYLEVGVLHGATLCAAACGNDVAAVGIDNFSQFDGKPEEVLRNLARFAPNATLLVSDCFELDPHGFPHLFEVYYYDGDHSAEATARGIGHFLPALTDPFLLLIDDWLWDSVKDGVARGIVNHGLQVGECWELLPPREGDGATWWNGLWLAEMRKPQ